MSPIAHNIYACSCIEIGADVCCEDVFNVVLFWDFFYRMPKPIGLLKSKFGFYCTCSSLKRVSSKLISKMSMEKNVFNYRLRSILRRKWLFFSIKEKLINVIYPQTNQHNGQKKVSQRIHWNALNIWIEKKKTKMKWWNEAWKENVN